MCCQQKSNLAHQTEHFLNSLGLSQTYPCGKDPIESIWKGDWVNYLYYYYYYLYLSYLSGPIRFLTASWPAPQCLTQLFRKPVWSKEKKSCPPEKSLHVLLLMGKWRPVLIKLPLWQHPLLSYQQHLLFTTSSCFFFFSVFLQFAFLKKKNKKQHLGAVFLALCLLLLYLWRELTDNEIHWNLKTKWTEVGKMDQLDFRVELWAIQLPGEVNKKRWTGSVQLKTTFSKG